LWVYDYKPKAGDVVVFPSTPPFYHSSLKTENGTKYIVRTYWRTNQEPTEEWEEGIKKYGEEEWIKQQEEKAKEIETQINKTIDGRNFGINVIINKDEENEF
jgi:heme-degrading monooxygenase HmoA